MTSLSFPVHVGRDAASDAGVTLANPALNGPPIGALAWPGLYYITSQSPVAGTTLYRWDSVAVEILPYGEADSNAVSIPHESPPAANSHAHPRHDAFIDLTDPAGQNH